MQTGQELCTSVNWFTVFSKSVATSRRLAKKMRARCYESWIHKSDWEMGVGQETGVSMVSVNVYLQETYCNLMQFAAFTEVTGTTTCEYWNHVSFSHAQSSSVHRTDFVVLLFLALLCEWIFLFCGFEPNINNIHLHGWVRDTECITKTRETRNYFFLNFNCFHRFMDNHLFGLVFNHFLRSLFSNSIVFSCSAMEDREWKRSLKRHCLNHWADITIAVKHHYSIKKRNNIDHFHWKFVQSCTHSHLAARGKATLLHLSWQPKRCSRWCRSAARKDADTKSFCLNMFFV